MIDLQTFNESIKKFEDRKTPANFLELAQNLIKSGFEAEGLLLILATWNFASFRYALKEFDINTLRDTLKKIQPHFSKLNGQNFQTINFENYKTDINIIYDSLSEIKGIGFTGTPKLMYLKSPMVFVMWDAYIRGEKAREYYATLEIFSNSTFEYKKYSKDFDGYFEFLKDMQDKFRHLNFSGEKSLAKAVDEFNYINITFAIQDIEKQKREAKKLKKQPSANSAS